MPMVAAALGGSVTAGLTFSVRQDPNGILWHARLGALLSRRLSGPVVMRNLGVPAMGPWYANQCTRARAPQHRFHLALVEYAINTEARSELLGMYQIKLQQIRTQPMGEYFMVWLALYQVTLLPPAFNLPWRSW